MFDFDPRNAGRNNQRQARDPRDRDWRNGDDDDAQTLGRGLGSTRARQSPPGVSTREPAECEPAVTTNLVLPWTRHRERQRASNPARCLIVG